MRGIGTTIVCDCCGSHKLGEMDSNGLEIQKKSHGRDYVATVSPRELLRQLAGTLEASAIVEYVRGVFVLKKPS